MAWAEAKGKLNAYNVGVHLKTSSVLGFLLVRSLAWLKPWRPRTYRYREEQALIERWLAAVRAAAARSPQLALEIARCAGLIKGYSDTHRRGLANFLAILDALVDHPATDDPLEQARAIARARDAALADPDGQALEENLGRRISPAGQPVIWLSKAH